MSSKELRFYTLQELRNKPNEQDKYIIDGILWEKDHVILLGSEKAGKSILSLQMACALSCGDSLFGEYEVVGPMSVALILTEGKEADVIERLGNMTGAGGVPCNPENIHILSTHSWQLDTDEGFNVLYNILLKQNIRPGVIILDPLYMSMAGDLNDNQASRAMSRNIRQLSSEFDAAVIVVHHTHREKWYDNKKMDEGDNAVMGSFVWKAFPDHILFLSKKKDGLRTLTCETQRSSRVIKDMQLFLNGPTPLYFSIHGTADHMPYVNTVESYMRLTGKELSAKDIITNTGLSSSAVRKSLSYLVRHNVGKIAKVNPGKRPTLYISTKA